MNFTVDDADASFIYSANGWAVQSQNDPDLNQFFQRTYHVATQDQATMSFQFSGSAFTLYGSKGPSHVRPFLGFLASFAVRLSCARVCTLPFPISHSLFPGPQASFMAQFDGTAVTVDASAQTTAFRQPLFSHVFSDNGTVAQHLVKVTASLGGGKNTWLDLDYITFTSGRCVSSLPSSRACILYLRRPILMRSHPIPSLSLLQRLNVIHRDRHLRTTMAYRVRTVPFPSLLFSALSFSSAATFPRAPFPFCTSPFVFHISPRRRFSRRDAR